MRVYLIKIKTETAHRKKLPKCDKTKNHNIATILKMTTENTNYIQNRQNSGFYHSTVKMVN